MNGKLIIFSAPSGAGKTTIEKEVLKQIPQLAFSVSATNRPKREDEENGKDYYFLDTEDIRQKIQNKQFLEWEEVYPNRFYGTLYSELDRIWSEGKHVLFDLDVKGGLNVKKKYKDKALTIFINVPSLEILRKRLEKRSTETPETLEVRLAKAAEEISYAKQFDVIILNDELEKAIAQAVSIIQVFLSR